MASTLRLGILGAANIARLFAAAVRPSSKVTVAAVAARDETRGRAFASEFGIGRVHGCYDALLADRDIEAVYVPLPNIRMDPALAGGALMDAGSYPLSVVRMVAGGAPRSVHAMARWAAMGVDRALVGSLDFAHGLFAQVSCSFATARHRRAFIVGEAGSIETTYYNDTSAQLPPTLIVRRGTGWDAKQETITTDAAAGFLAETEAFADLVAHGWTRWPGATPEESVDIARTLDALAASAREGRTIELAR